MLRADGTLPLSGVLRSGDREVLGMGLPVELEDGRPALVVGLWDVRLSGLQTYVDDLVYGSTGHGYVVDSAGTVLAGPGPQAGRDELGEELRHADVLAAVRRQASSGLVTTTSGEPMVVSYADAGRTGWTAVTMQDSAEFEGALKRSSDLVQALVVLLLLIAGTGLVVLHRKRESALRDVALTDDLTGVYNRRGWTTLADHELARARRQGTPRVLLFVDLDGLKRVNDALGHREGDRAIADAAHVLTTASRASDLVGRLGGDEFVLLLGEQGRPEGARRRVLEALAAHNARSGAAFELRLSVGAEVWFPDSADSLADLVRRADEQMYEQKSGRPQRAEGILRVPRQRAADEPVTTA